LINQIFKIMRKILILLGIIFIANESLAQNYNILINEIYDLQGVQSSTTLIYYGLDFSLLKLVKPQYVTNENVLRKYFGAWLSFYHNKFPPQNLTKMLKFDQTFFNDNAVQIRIDSVPKNWVVFSTHNVKIDSISNTIRTYNLGQDKGLGFVIHPIEFNTLTMKSTCYFTFFDIVTKKILWIAEISVDVKGLGLTQPFGYGMIESTKVFINDLYKKNVKKK
jgi:hypothetical protein